MASRCRAPRPLSLAALLLLIWAPGLGAQTKIKCHHENKVDTFEKIFQVYNQSALGLNQCDAPLNNSACHIIYNYRGRVSLNFGCGNCSTVVYDKYTNTYVGSQGCGNCSSTNCNFDQKNANFPEYYKKEFFDDYRECLAFHGDEPSDFKSASAVRIQCIGDDTGRMCVRSFYLDNKIKKLFIGCQWDCKEAIKGKKMTNGTGRDARCDRCKPEGAASTALVKDVCLGPPSEIDEGLGDKPQDKIRNSRAPLAPAPAGGPPALLASATVVLLALHLATGH